MDFAALFLSIEVTKRSARSALPNAEVAAPRGRWRRRAAARARSGPA